MSEPKVVNFPLNRNRRHAPASTDDMLAAEIGKAWRKLCRTIRAAQAAGLQVEARFISTDAPKVSRHF
jgi:hypothetical protein